MEYDKSVRWLKTDRSQVDEHVGSKLRNFSDGLFTACTNIYL